MKTMNLSLLLVIIFLALSCVNTNDSDNLKKYRVVESSSVIEDTACYTINIEYPYFVADGDEEQGFDTLNETIQFFMDTAARYYWGVEPDSAKVLIDETGAAGKYVLDNKYQLLDTTPDVISILMETYTYALGAHGFTALHTYNFDVKERRFIAIGDLLDFSNPETTDQLNQLLAKNFVNPEDCFNDIPTADEQFELFGIEKGNIVFYYEAYTLGPYYCGWAKVVVPIEQLKAAGLWKRDRDI